MTEPNFLILYVRDPLASVAFYGKQLGLPTLESSPSFAKLKLNAGTMLGLWAHEGVQPPATAPGGAELAVAVDDDTVRSLHAQWSASGEPIVQAPVEMDFGFTFTALDPDGHRLRVFAPSSRTA
jgi:predicted enzyme related to lactoylglutathione lyase